MQLLTIRQQQDLMRAFAKAAPAAYSEWVTDQADIAASKVAAKEHFRLYKATGLVETRKGFDYGQSIGDIPFVGKRAKP